jgi:CheY-like chemotaxis protein
LRVPEGPPEAVDYSPAKGNGGIMSPVPPLRVLVVDNNEPVCAVTADMLESLGHRADCETDSLNALKIFSEDPGKFDLAIIEPLLPNLTGLDLAIRFRDIRPGFPVMFYAGYVEESLSSRIAAGGLGPVAFKPFTISELAAAIKNRQSL